MSQSQPVLIAETTDVRPFARLLRGVGLKHNAVMTISEAGFEVTVEEIKTLCAIAWIPTNLFSSFTFNKPADEEPPACFEISLDGLLQCLNIFGNATTAGAGPPAMAVKRRHDDAKGPTTSCQLRVLEPEELMNQEFNQADCVLYLIMKSEWFRDALADLPPTSSRITLTATPRHQPAPPDVAQATASSNARRTHRADVGNFSIKAIGDFGSVELDYPNDKEVMDRFDCESVVSFSYHSSHFALLSRALAQSIKICLQVESTGFLCVQIMMPVGENVPLGHHSGILEFKMHALEEDDN
ncbi:Rad1/Rec1/Rad17 [Papiliotrema laurentii]|uniref:Rad1/Rec1/Rad17 n=1 Tax=Papiliotrema laurentii TaxID=5418 RepID=A0AAD9FS65_PAPLA|nr:Rad1/Rec1/Rad17 [Papiliotrema laurentii]